MRIRPFEERDYPAVAALLRAAYSDSTGTPLLPITEESVREEDAEYVPPFRVQRWVAEVDAQVVGAAEYNQQPGRYDPRKFTFDLAVHPEYQRRGVGAALHAAVIDALRALDAVSARVTTREDLVAALRFLERRGWQERSRIWESFLDLRSFDPAPFAGVVEGVRAQGVAFRTLRELASDPERDQKLYDLLWEIRQDFPDLDAATRETFAEFQEKHLGASNLLPDAYMVAVQDGEYLGFAAHTRFGDTTDTIRIGQTGVKRSARRRHIATAIKLLAIEWARAQGYARMRTTNESSNRGILAINERMGFVKRPAWVDFVLPLADDA